MDDLRIALIVIGVAALAGVYVWGRRRRLRADDEILGGLESWRPHGPDPLDDSREQNVEAGNRNLGGAAAGPKVDSSAVVPSSGFSGGFSGGLSGRPDGDGYIDGVRYPVRVRRVDAPVEPASTGRVGAARTDQSSQDEPSESPSADGSPARASAPGSSGARTGADPNTKQTRQRELPFSAQDSEPDEASLASLAGLRVDERRPSQRGRRDGRAAHGRHSDRVDRVDESTRQGAARETADASAEWPSEYKKPESLRQSASTRAAANTSGRPTGAAQVSSGANKVEGVGSDVSASAASPSGDRKTRDQRTSNFDTGQDAADSGAQSGALSAFAEAGDETDRLDTNPPANLAHSQFSARSGSHAESDAVGEMVARTSDAPNSADGLGAQSQSGARDERRSSGTVPKRQKGRSPEPRRRSAGLTDTGRARSNGDAERGQGMTEFVVLNVLAPVGGRFEGGELLEALQSVGLHYGDMNVFHFRESGQPKNSSSLFTVLNVIKPGTLVPERIQSTSTPGVAFVMPLPPSQQDAVWSFDTMYEVAKSLSATLGGRLCDETRSTLSAQALNHMRERMVEFDRRARLR